MTAQALDYHGNAGLLTEPETRELGRLPIDELVKFALEHGRKMPDGTIVELRLEREDDGRVRAEIAARAQHLIEVTGIVLDIDGDGRLGLTGAPRRESW